MKITVEFIDNKGFWHSRTAKSKKLLLAWFAQLRSGSEIFWQGKNHCTISQQYCTAKIGLFAE